MLRFQLSQLCLPSQGRFFIPLPKLSRAQISLVSEGLVKRGFHVRTGSGNGRRLALKGGQRIAIDGRLGLASSSQDMLDVLAPMIPSILASCKGDDSDVAARYFALKTSDSGFELQLFPRMESLGIWTGLRKEGLCGLTADEFFVLKHVVGRSSNSSRIQCISDRPSRDSRLLQFGRHVYYETTMPPRSFLSSLRTIDPDSNGSAYLPRDSIIRLRGTAEDVHVSASQLGEWCCGD